MRSCIDMYSYCVPPSIDPRTDRSIALYSDRSNPSVHQQHISSHSPLQHSALEQYIGHKYHMYDQYHDGI